MSRSDDLEATITAEREQLRSSIAAAVVKMDANAAFDLSVKQALREATMLTGMLAELDVAKS